MSLQSGSQETRDPLLTSGLYRDDEVQCLDQRFTVPTLLYTPKHPSRVDLRDHKSRVLRPRTVPVQVGLVRLLVLRRLPGTPPVPESTQRLSTRTPSLPEVRRRRGRVHGDSNESILGSSTALPEMVDPRTDDTSLLGAKVEGSIFYYLHTREEVPASPVLWTVVLNYPRPPGGATENRVRDSRVPLRKVLLPPSTWSFPGSRESSLPQSPSRIYFETEGRSVRL